MPMFGGMSGPAGKVRDYQGEQAARDMENKLRGVENFIRMMQEVEITTADGKTLTVWTRGPGIADTGATGTRAPWEIQKLDGLLVRVWPSAIWDGKGNSVWPTFDGVPSSPESSFDIQLPTTPTTGYIWVECTVVDTDDYHGIITSARIGRGTAPTFLTKEASIVNIPLCTYQVGITGQSVTLDPTVFFVFYLRRFGPPTSLSWSITPY